MIQFMLSALVQAEICFACLTHLLFSGPLKTEEVDSHTFQKLEIHKLKRNTVSSYFVFASLSSAKQLFQLLAEDIFFLVLAKANIFSASC